MDVFARRRCPQTSRDVQVRNARLRDAPGRLKNGEDATARLRSVPKPVEGVRRSRSAVPLAALPCLPSPRCRDERRSAMASAGFPRYPAIPVATDAVRLVCAGEPRPVLEDDNVTERRSADGRKLWKVPCMLGTSGQLRRSEIVQVTVESDDAPVVEFGERLEASGLVVFFWGMERNGEAIAGLSFRADQLGSPSGRKTSSATAQAA